MLRIFATFLREDHIVWMKLQSAESVRGRVYRLFALLMTLCLLHSVAIVYFEQLSIGDALWLTFTTVTTVGYGDFSASTLGGRLSTIFLIYLAGISLLAQVAGEFIEYRMERRNRMILGRWRWKRMKDHILILNVPDEDSTRYLKRLVHQVRHTPEIKDIPIQILAPAFPDGLPMELREAGVVHRCASPDTYKELEICNASSAKYILLLAPNSYNQTADAVTLNVLLHLRDLGVSALVVAEAVLDENRERFMHFGASAVLRPIRAYPEILVRALVAPGSEVIMEDLFTHGGVFPKRIDVNIKDLWGSIATKLIMANLGVPLGYVSTTDRVETSPDVNHPVEVKALLLMVTPEHQVDAAKVKALFK